MHPSQAPEFSQLMTALGELYARPLTEALHEIYWLVLEGYALEEVKEAMVRHINNPDCGQFMPKPADLIRALEGNTESQAKLAWAKVEKALKHHGPYQTVVFDDPVVHAVISDMGGWISLANVTDEDWKFKGYDFEKRYRAYAMNPCKQYPHKLVGIIEHQNQSEGHKPPAPVLIGDSNKAKAVLENSTTLLQTEAIKPIQQVLLRVISNSKQEKTQQEAHP